ncbi:MAG: hypothetical protein RLZZ378_502 [Actinomycetota bacterium]|jgi:exodeoxyribonuclease VII small subunit
MSDQSLSYEKARDELIKIVEKLESGTATLDESLKLWQRGEELAKICQNWLDGAREKLSNAKVATNSGNNKDKSEI